MWQLHTFPLCPFSRKLRLLMSEKGVPYEIVREAPWEAREAFLQLNPAGRVPVLVGTERRRVLCDSRAIAEFFEETVERAPMLGGSAVQRAEIRRLVALFDENFHADVTAPVLHEKLMKRIVHRASPDAGVLRQMGRMLHGHLDYIDWLVDTRQWLAGPTLSLADLALAAHLSVVDYLGAVDITSDEHIQKANLRPYVPEPLRAMNLASLEMVDYVIIDREAKPLKFTPENLAEYDPERGMRRRSVDSSGDRGRLRSSGDCDRPRCR